MRLGDADHRDKGAYYVRFNMIICRILFSYHTICPCNKYDNITSLRKIKSGVSIKILIIT